MTAVRSNPGAFDGIAVVDLGKTFENGTNALRDVNLKVPTGSLVAIIGPSGCGKSSLLRILAGLDYPTIGGVSEFGFSPNELRKKGRIGIAFQKPSLLPWRNVNDNVKFPLEILGRDRTEDIPTLLRLVRLTGAETLMPHQLSGGMAQRVSIARSLVGHPRLLLLDEPFGSLDWLLRKQIIHEFEAIWADSRPTTVMVTHDVREAAFLAHRIVVMSPRPGTVADTIEVDFTRPRRPALFSSREFQVFCTEVENRLERA